MSRAGNGPALIYHAFLRGGDMKKDGEIRLLVEERCEGASQKLAAARTGMSERTARKYEQAGKLPSQMKVPRTHRTRENPFAADWLWVKDQLQRDQALQTTRSQRFEAETSCAHST
jgi:hypothetical protein